MTNNSNKMPFSKAELLVVEQLARGYSEKEIAEKLHLSFHTVNNHLRNIRTRYNLQKNTEVIILYATTLSKNNVSFRSVKELGLSILFGMVNICGNSQMYS